MSEQNIPLLVVKDFSVKLNGSAPNAFILHNIDLIIDQGQTVAIIGQSGSGKTMTAQAILGVLPDGMTITAGHIYFKGCQITAQSSPSFEDLRGKHISMVFQEAMAALNPVFQIGVQLRDIVRTNLGVSQKTAKEKSLVMLAEVGFQNPVEIYRMYPNQLSGGMAQRVVIAMALSCEPDLVIADEPTSALDTTTQAKILNLIGELQNQHRFALIIISHDLHLVSDMASNVYVFNQGRVVSKGNLNSMKFSNKDTYLQSLLQTLPESFSTES